MGTQKNTSIQVRVNTQVREVADAFAQDQGYRSLNDLIYWVVTRVSKGDMILSEPRPRSWGAGLDPEVIAALKDYNENGPSHTLKSKEDIDKFMNSLA